MLEEFKVLIPYVVDLSMRYIGQDPTSMLNFDPEEHQANRTIEHYVRTEKVIGEGDLTRLYRFHDAVHEVPCCRRG